MRKMTQGSIARHLIAYALPLILGNLFQLTYNAVDSIVIGKFAGENALAAVSAANPVMTIVILGVSGVSIGASVLMSRFYGAGDEDALRREVATTIVFGAIASLVVFAVGWPLSGPVLRLMNVPDDYDVLFLQGGGTLQFDTIPLNLARREKTVAVVDSGHWAVRARQEADLLPGISTYAAASGEAENYTKLPYSLNLDRPCDYVHVTLNNTIEGTMYRKLPDVKGNVVVADMSSNILAQRYNVEDFGLIMAGAQKNIGPAGLTVVIVKHSLLDESQNLPSMLDYVKLSKKHSTLNTPPVFAIYAAGLVFKQLLEEGGVDAAQKRNEEKSRLLYEFLDNSKLFKSPVFADDRSTTNIPFVTGDEELDRRFIKEADEAGFKNLKGHRLVGGMRASLYNAFPLEGVRALVEFMEKFETEVKGEN